MNLTGVGGCCKDCTERYPACHDHCERYQKTVREWQEKKILKKKAEEFYIYKVEKIRKDEKRRSKHGK